jgi:hypothetical protein
MTIIAHKGLLRKEPNINIWKVTNNLTTIKLAGILIVML